MANEYAYTKDPDKKPTGKSALARKNKENKKLNADEFFQIKDSKKKFTGPKSTEGSVGDEVNKFRKMDDDIKKQQKLSKGGRVNFKGGGCAKRGVKKNAYGKNS
jgi:hypothetical protein